MITRTELNEARAKTAVMYSFSSCARDTLDPFTDPNIVLPTVVID